MHRIFFCVKSASGMRARSRSRFFKCELERESAHFEALSGKLRARSRFSERCPTLPSGLNMEPMPDSPSVDFILPTTIHTDYFAIGVEPFLGI